MNKKTQQDIGSLTVQITEIFSSQEWAIDPQMIEVYVDKGFLEKAEKCVAFMQEHDVNQVILWWAFDYKMFEDIENVSEEDDLSGKAVVKSMEDGDVEEYIEFEPEYRVSGCHAKIDKDGEIHAVFPFNNSDEEVWCTVGKLDDLQARIGMTPHNAELLATAPEILAERDRLREVNRELIEALQAIEARMTGVWDHPALIRCGGPLKDREDDAIRISRDALNVASCRMAGGIVVDATQENQINTGLMEALSQLIDHFDHHGNIDSVREEGLIEDARAALERAQAFGADVLLTRNFSAPSGG